MIIPKSQKNKGIDVYTDEIIKDNAVHRVKNSDAIEEVAEVMIYLSQNKKVKKNLEKNIYAASNFHIKSRQQRIKFEFNLLSILDSGTKTELKNYLEAT